MSNLVTDKLALVSTRSDILWKVIPPYEEETKQLFPLAKAMYAFMIANKGSGLAAPQVGREVRMFVILRTKHAAGFAQAMVCINPELLSTAGDSFDFREGCLSSYGLTYSVSRPETIEVRYTTLKGKVETKILRGLVARCFQHELDHLNGKNIFPDPRIKS